MNKNIENSTKLMYKEDLRGWRIRKKIVKIIIYICLSIWALIVLFPFYWMILSSIKSLIEYNSELTPKFYVDTPTIQNYVLAFREVSLGGYFLNTIIFAFCTTLIMMIVSTLAAFAFARLKFKGKNFAFVLLLSLMMIPNELVIITNYTSIVNLDLRDTFTGLIFPSVASVFFIYLLKENFAQIPDSLYYAAKVDGTSDMKYLLKVMVPICKPTMVTIFILKIIECWNSYVWPRAITTKETRYLVSNGIQMIKESGFGKDAVPKMMAAVVAVSLPLIIIFLVFRNQIMTGVSRSGTKG